MKRFFFLTALLLAQFASFSQGVFPAPSIGATKTMKWGLMGLILISFFMLLIIISRVFRWLSPSRNDKGYQQLDDSALFTTDASFADNDYSSSDTDSLDDFGGGDSGGAGAGDNW